MSSLLNVLVIISGAVLGLRFSEHPLAVSERIGNMKLCLRKVPGTEVAPDILLNVTLVELSEKKLGKKVIHTYYQYFYFIHPPTLSRWKCF